MTKSLDCETPLTYSIAGTNITVQMPSLFHGISLAPTGSCQPGPCTLHRCVTFLYGGCSGSANNFESLADCVSTCVPAVPGPAKGASVGLPVQGTASASLPTQPLSGLAAGPLQGSTASQGGITAVYTSPQGPSSVPVNGVATTVPSGSTGAAQTLVAPQQAPESLQQQQEQLAAAATAAAAPSTAAATAGTASGYPSYINGGLVNVGSPSTGPTNGYEGGGNVGVGSGVIQPLTGSGDVGSGNANQPLLQPIMGAPAPYSSARLRSSESWAFARMIAILGVLWVLV
jgi:Kunitz/Bovine pancreatic trypsin inhibitor domain